MTRMRHSEGYRNPATLVELVTRVLCDTNPSQTADAAHLFGESRDNQDSVLLAGSSLWRLGRTRCLYIPEITGPGCGFEQWKSELTESGVPESRVIRMPLLSKFPNSTDAEGDSIAQLAKVHGWENIYIIAPPLHQLRAFLSTISALKRKRVKLNVYNFTGPAQGWNERIVHSQGRQRGTRHALIYKEFEKIERYFQKRDLIGCKEALAYLNRRDRAT